MSKFIQWLFRSARYEKQQGEISKKTKMPVNVSADGLSAEKNILRSIRYKTGMPLDEIRGFLFFDIYLWPVQKRPGDRQRYYDQTTRDAMIKVCVEHFGLKK